MMCYIDIDRMFPLSTTKEIVYFIIPVDSLHGSTMHHFLN